MAMVHVPGDCQESLDRCVGYGGGQHLHNHSGKMTVNLLRSPLKKTPRKLDAVDWRSGEVMFDHLLKVAELPDDTGATALPASSAAHNHAHPQHDYSAAYLKEVVHNLLQSPLRKTPTKLDAFDEDGGFLMLENLLRVAELPDDSATLPPLASTREHDEADHVDVHDIFDTSVPIGNLSTEKDQAYEYPDPNEEDAIKGEQAGYSNTPLNEKKKITVDIDEEILLCKTVKAGNKKKVVAAAPTTTANVKKQVQFAEYDDVFEVLHLNDFTDEEFENYFMDPYDYLWIQEECSEEIASFDEYAPALPSPVSVVDETETPPELPEGHFLRGLDTKTLKYKQQSRQAVHQVYEAVFTLQEIQSQLGVEDADDIIAKACTKHSLPAVVAAQFAAISDIFTSFKDKWSRPSRGVKYAKTRNK